MPYKGKSAAKMSLGSSRGKGSRNERANSVGKGPPIGYDGLLGPNYFEEAAYEFLVQSKSDFKKEVRLRSR